MKWLVSAFEPFGGATENSSLQVLEILRLDSALSKIAFADPLPVTFKDAWPSLKRQAEAHGADAVIALGQAEGRAKIALEMLALNIDHAAIPDNRGEQPKQKKIAAGPDVLWTSLPFGELEGERGLSLSFSAGTFVCNHLYFHLLEWCRAHDNVGGFIHIPAFKTQTEKIEAAASVKHALFFLQEKYP